MKPTVHFVLFLSILGFILLLVERTNAQNSCRSERYKIPWVVPPAIAGIDGDAKGSPGKIFIADRSGSIWVWNLTLLASGLQWEGRLTPGNQLPSDVLAIWDIKVLETGIIYALATYADQGTEWYGFLKSTDKGDSWEWVKPASMKDPHFQSLEGQSFGFTDFTGNYWRVALNEMAWLDDGLHGWVWGRKGVIRTTDGGATWTIAYKAETENNQNLGLEYKPLWGLAFHSPDSGVAVIGPTVGSEYSVTTDGGVTWRSTKSLEIGRLADLEYVRGEYRALTFNRTQRWQNTLMQISQNGGQTWSTLPSLNSKVLSESVYASEFVWPSGSTGFFIQRQGEVWRTDNGGETWEVMQKTDLSYDTVLYGDGTAIDGIGPPLFPYAGYGQRTILVRDDIGNPYLINVITDTCVGTIRDYIATWRVDTISSVQGEDAISTLDLQTTPNPVAENLELHFTLRKPRQTTVSFVDTRGVVVKAFNLGLLESGKQTKLLKLGEISSGLYQMVLRSGTDRRIEAIVVIR